MREFIIKEQILHITHNDSDGLGCALVVDYLRHKLQYSDLVSHSFNSVDSSKSTISLIISVLESVRDNECIDNTKLKTFKYLTFKCNYNDYGVLCLPNYIIISDLSVDPILLDKLNDLCDHFNINILYVDHHNTNLSNNKRYEWCYVNSVDDNNCTRSACKYLLDIIDDKYNDSDITITNDKSFRELINDISRYDTWLWKKEPRTNPNEYWTNCIIDAVGNVELAYNNIALVIFNKKNIIYTLKDIQLFSDYINTYDLKREMYIKKYLKNVVYTTGDKLCIKGSEYSNANFAILILPESFSNDIMESIYMQTDKCVDIVLGLYPSRRTITLRKDTKNKFDVSKLAMKYGGGGHRDASGATLDTTTFIDLISRYYLLFDAHNNNRNTN